MKTMKGNYNNEDKVWRIEKYTYSEVRNVYG